MLLNERAGDADRNEAVERLNAAFAEGRIDIDELDERVQAAYSARTYGELRNLQSDLPDSVQPRSAGTNELARRPSDPVSAYFSLRVRQFEVIRNLVHRPKGDRGLTALLIGPLAFSLFVVVNVAYLVICLAIGVPSDSPLLATVWPLVGVTWGSTLVTLEIMRRFDREQ